MAELVSVSARYSDEAKAKELATRRALGPRIGHAPKGARLPSDAPFPRSTLNRRRNRQAGDSDSQY